MGKNSTKIQLSPKSIEQENFIGNLLPFVQYDILINYNYNH